MRFRTDFRVNAPPTAVTAALQEPRFLARWLPDVLPGRDAVVRTRLAVSWADVTTHYQLAVGLREIDLDDRWARVVVQGREQAGGGTAGLEVELRWRGADGGTDVELDWDLVVAGGHERTPYDVVETFVQKASAVVGARMDELLQAAPAPTVSNVPARPDTPTTGRRRLVLAAAAAAVAAAAALLAGRRL